MINVNELKVVAVLEMAEGNQTVGTSWLSTRTFDQSEPIQNIVDWAFRQDGNHGKLIITVDGMSRL